jgi:hypothetical protein
MVLLMVTTVGYLPMVLRTLTRFSPRFSARFGET